VKNITVIKADSEFLLNKFIKVPWKIYKGDKNWVPPLIFDVKNNLDTKKNPFYKHSRIQLYLAQKDGGEYIGRIAAIINDNHNKTHNDKVGFFGFFECINDLDVAKALFDEASSFLKENGMDTIRGPVNPSTNDECGLLIEGFELPPVILMLYNPSYYLELIENSGFEKANDLLAFRVDAEEIRKEGALAKLERVSEIIKKKENIKIRKFNLKDLDNEVQRVREVYNEAWEKNWGFVPMTEAEFNHIAKSLKLILNPDLTFFAECEGKPIGFSLSLPDFNQVFIKMNGRFFPFGIFKFLANKKKINQIRVMIMGVIPQFQRKGIDAVFVLDTIKNGLNIGIKMAEISWILEDNIPMVQTAEKLNAKLYKRYRIFDKKL
jgi:hypothetical protein